MKPHYSLTHPAIRDIEAIADYLAQQSGLDRGEDFLHRLTAKLTRIAQFPNIGKRRDELLPGARSLPLDNYLIFYTITTSGVDILRIVSGYRDLSALFDE